MADNNMDAYLQDAEKTAKAEAFKKMWSQQSQSSYIVQSIIFVAVCTTWFTLFKIFTEDSYYYGDETKCGALLPRCRDVSGMYMILLIIECVLLVMSIFLKYITGWLKEAFSLLNLATSLTMAIVGLYYLIRVTIDLQENTPCGKLTTLAFVWMIITYVSIGLMVLLCLCACCCMCFGAAALMGMSASGH